MKYSWIDNEMSPTEIKLEASACNVLIGKELKQLEFILTINKVGISEIHVNGFRFNIIARCTD